MRKHTFAPVVDPSTLIDDEAVLQALTSIEWTSFDLQTMEGEEEPTQGNTESSTRQDQNNWSEGRLLDRGIELLYEKL